MNDVVTVYRSEQRQQETDGHIAQKPWQAKEDQQPTVKKGPHSSHFPL